MFFYKMANPKEWGPHIWKILHICSENLGKNTQPILQVDEIRAFNTFVNKLLYLLPCSICREHYNKYILKYKKDLIYDEFKIYGRDFFYKIHEDVNKRNGAASFPYESMNIYRSVTKKEFNEIIKEFEKLFQKYIMYHYTTTKALNEFMLSIRMLRVYINF